MSIPTEPAEISEDLLTKEVPGVVILNSDPDGEFIATVSDLREALAPLGLDITTIDALAWNTDYPAKARNITRICELQQEIADLLYQLGIEPISRVRPGKPPDAEDK